MVDLLVLAVSQFVSGRLKEVFEKMTCFSFLDLNSDRTFKFLFYCLIFQTVLLILCLLIDLPVSTAPQLPPIPLKVFRNKPGPAQVGAISKAQK